MQKKIYGELKIFSGTAHPVFGNKICDYLNIELGKAELFKFSNDNTFVRILENIREKDVFIIQPASSPVNDVELLSITESDILLYPKYLGGFIVTRLTEVKELLSS